MLPYLLNSKNMILRISTCLIFLCFAMLSRAQKQPSVYFSDLDNFWRCYDLTLQCSTDSCIDKIISEEYIPKSSVCFKELIAEKRFKADYVKEFWKYRQFLTGMHNLSLQLPGLKDSLYFYFEKLGSLYSGSALNDVYFMVSSWKQGGTITPSGLSIGIQYFCGGDSLITSEIKGPFAYFISPSAKLIPVVIHEQVHKWKKPSSTNYIFQKCMSEGNCDFIAHLITGTRPFSDKIWTYFEENKDSIFNTFKKEFYGFNEMDWISIASKKFKYGAAGYYVGYKICEAYYNTKKNKRKAIKEIIEMENPLKIIAASGLVEKSVFKQ